MTKKARLVRRYLRVRLWGIALLAAGSLLIVGTILSSNLPTLGGDDLWNLSLLAWSPIILGIVFLWPSS